MGDPLDLDAIEDRAGEVDPLGDIRALVAEARRLRAQADDVTAARDEAEEWADRIALAVAPVEEIGEHSSANNPWANAIEAAGRLRQRVAGLEVAVEPDGARRLELAKKLAVSAGNLLRVERDDARARAERAERRVADLEAAASRPTVVTDAMVAAAVDGALDLVYEAFPGPRGQLSHRQHDAREGVRDELGGYDSGCPFCRLAGSHPLIAGPARERVARAMLEAAAAVGVPPAGSPRGRAEALLIAADAVKALERIANYERPNDDEMATLTRDCSPGDGEVLRRTIGQDPQSIAAAALVDLRERHRVAGIPTPSDPDVFEAPPGTMLRRVGRLGATGTLYPRGSLVAAADNPCRALYDATWPVTATPLPRCEPHCGADCAAPTECPAPDSATETSR